MIFHKERGLQFWIPGILKKTICCSLHHYPGWYKLWPAVQKFNSNNIGIQIDSDTFLMGFTWIVSCKILQYCLDIAIYKICQIMWVQGCINRWILQSEMQTRGVISVHVENMELRYALCLRARCSLSQSTVLWFSEHRALDKYFKDHNQRGGGKWRMYHSDRTRFYETDDSRVTWRLLKEKSKLTFVNV